MAVFYNQASLSYGGTVTNSNITEGEITTGITMTKSVASGGYGPGDGIVYVISIVNSGNADAVGLTLTDNLGIYTVPGGTLEVTPLTYVEDSLLYYQNGAIASGATAVGGPPLVITGITVPANGNATLIYEARANNFAPLSAGSSIYNTATLSGCEELSASAQVGTRDEANLTISKSVCPSPVSCGEEITYTFVIQNLGNTPVVATDELVLRDTFVPPLSDISVTLDGDEYTSYTYDEQTGVFSTTPATITVPAATFVRNPETGVVTTTPGVTVLTVTGTV